MTRPQTASRQRSTDTSGKIPAEIAVNGAIHKYLRPGEVAQQGERATEDRVRRRFKSAPRPSDDRNRISRSTLTATQTIAHDVCSVIRMWSGGDSVTRGPHAHASYLMQGPVTGQPHSSETSHNVVRVGMCVCLPSRVWELGDPATLLR